MIARIEVHAGRYHDSVRLMQASRAVASVPGVDDALAAMATELNLELLRDMGFDLSDAAGAGPNDLLLAVRADDEAVFAEVRRVLDDALAARAAPDGAMDAPEPHTIGGAVRRMDANVALISVPGEHAFVEAMDAIANGLHVMIFSDNVSVDHEIALKRRGVADGLLVMGPDCGTAIVGGVGLGFANVVIPGPVGIVGASGTGIQQACCLLDDAGIGVRHALGTGSHDLAESVGALSTVQALRALDADPTIDLIMVISKPPAAAVAEAVREAAKACTTPVVLTFMGETTLEEGVAEVLTRLGGTIQPYASWVADTGARPGFVRGLFSGGTLRDDARFIARPLLGAIGTGEDDAGHTFIDYGDDEYTQGRAHPMIDQTVRLDRLRAAAVDDTVGVVLLDVVLGHGANPDPAAELAPVIERAVRAGPAVVVSLCGTRGDPQGRDRQAGALHGAGASVYLSNAAATRAAAELAMASDPTGAAT